LATEADCFSNFSVGISVDKPGNWIPGKRFSELNMNDIDLSRCTANRIQRTCIHVIKVLIYKGSSEHGFSLCTSGCSSGIAAKAHGAVIEKLKVNTTGCCNCPCH